GLPDPRRDVLLVPEGHRAHVPRGHRQDQLLAHLPGHRDHLLPDAHRRPAGHAAAAVHLPARPGLDRPESPRVDRRLRARGRTARLALQGAAGGMNDVTRSTEATSATAASYAARRRRALPSGWWGMALLVATEAALFGTVLSTYWYLRFNSVQWPPPGIKSPDVVLPICLTG